jgi:uncharacterized membrane protein
MNINATMLGEFMLLFVLLVGAFSYYLARYKTKTPLLAALLGVLLSLMPPLALIYLVALVFKKDLSPTVADS